MAAPKNIKDYADAIVQIIDGGGGLEDAAKALDLSLRTLNNWRKNHPDLDRRITDAQRRLIKAKAETACCNIRDTQELANRYLIKLLRGEITKKKTRKDKVGNIIWEEEEQILPSDQIICKLASLEEASVDYKIEVSVASPEELPDEEEPEALPWS